MKTDDSVVLARPSNCRVMAQAVRAVDWSTTPLGPMESWSERLKTSVDICLQSLIPTFVWWQRELIQIYNDAAIDVLGVKHPRALGQSARETWVEEWSMLGPLVDEVIASGDSIRLNEIWVHLDRGFGLEDICFTLNLSPLRGNDGHFDGVIIKAIENTLQNQAAHALREREERHEFLLRLSDELRPLVDPFEIQSTACRLLGERLRVHRVSYADVDGNDFIIRHCYVQGISPMVGRFPLQTFGENVVAACQRGETVCAADVMVDPKFSDMERKRLMAVSIRAFAGAMLMKRGSWVASFGLHHAAPHHWKIWEIRLIEEVAQRTWEAVERARAEISLQQARAKADREKDEFLAMMAHELRNPLAPIRTAMSILRSRDTTDPMIGRCREIIERQTIHMTRLLEDLLDVSRLSRGKMTLQPTRISFKTVLEAAIETSRPLIDQQRHELIIDAPEVNFALQADSARLTQVFANLLNNAAKYSLPGNRIEIVVREMEGNLVVKVLDRGIGIAPEMLGRIFDPFAQGENARTHAPGGLGIGLSLAKRLVEMHGGTIRASSNGMHQGSEFIVTLPLDAVAEKPIVNEVPLANTALPFRRILVVDDNVDAADTTALLLERPGCEIKTVYGGAAAVREAESFRPEVVVLDLGMPGVDGYEACRRIRGSSWGKSMLLVALSGWGQEEDRRRSALAGFDLHLMKPVDPDGLVQALRDIRPRATYR